MFGGLRRQIRRLRKTPSVLFRSEPDPRELLEASRRYDPGAEPVDDGIRLSTGRLLRGPVELAPEQSTGARIPAGWYFALLAEGGTKGPDPIVTGLARALDGSPHLADPVNFGHPDDPVTAVYTAKAIDPATVGDLVSARLPGARITGKDRKFYGFTAADDDEPLLLAFDATVSAKPRRRRSTNGQFPAVRHLGETVYRCSVHLTDDTTTLHQTRLRRAGELALALAEATGGVALDVCGFRLGSPDDVDYREFATQ
ncbi:hypothetical protein [Prauserella cavernicola]|uniref:Uncharacterized protein n=1 Tax=Prauserella cavernicola TaxID=2800127 RepID=A0A934QPM2_9PSEU|nr:hypothetical protein [Prauserella cavernicola]MBK1783424.1 hypothetical protein [Prauserella cavernicola]